MMRRNELWTVASVAALVIGAVVFVGLLAFRTAPSWFMGATAGAAALGTLLTTSWSLQSPPHAFRRLFIGSIVPPTVLFLPTILGVMFAAPAGAVTALVLMPLVAEVHRSPARWRATTTVWAAVVSVMALALSAVLMAN